ncbi:hypothetical protein [Candidatus Ruthturnera calyptogenae]|uniref:hypothetical protein n=1 Tax=Candidatus Ruthturnera calyptogenae TaxID=386487 RepID=UPI00031FE932|nr:hypothetical protein [Candidatus Ruthturnera calyptogenae]
MNNNIFESGAILLFFDANNLNIGINKLIVPDTYQLNELSNADVGHEYETIEIE